MQRRPFLFVSLLLAGCGSTPPQEHPPTPLVEIAQAEKAPPIETGDKDADDERGIRANVFESPDVCLKKMREGRGLPIEAMMNEDGLLYTEALTAERADNLNNARKSYLKLLQSFPQSPLVPHAYFAFGELFYRETQGDPTKFALAEQSFIEVIKYSDLKNTTLPFAYFRLAQLYATRGRGAEALNTLKKFGDLNETRPEAQCLKALGDSSRKLMATTYADVARPDRAFGFFMHSMGDHAPDLTNAFETLANLCDVYLRQQKPESAAAALIATTEARAPWAFCEREEKIMAAIASSMTVTAKNDLARMHADRCQRE